MSPREDTHTGDQARLGQLEDLEREAHRIRRSVSGTTGTAQSSDQLIEATVGVYGELVDLVIDPRIYRTQDTDGLAEQIRTAVNKARQAAQNDVQRDLARYLPKDPGDSSDLAFQPFLRLFGQAGKGATR